MIPLEYMSAQQILYRELHGSLKFSSGPIRRTGQTNKSLGCKMNAYTVMFPLGLPSIPSAIAFNKSENQGKLLAAACEDGFISILDTHKRLPIFSCGDEEVQPRAHWRAHKNSISELAWSKGDSRLISVSADTTAAVWDMTKTTLICDTLIHSRSVKTVTQQPGSDDVFVTGCMDGGVSLWDCRKPGVWSSQQRRHVLTPVGSILDAHSICHRSNVTPPLCRGRSYMVDKKKVTEHSITSTLFIPQTQLLVTSGSGDTCVKVWDIRNINFPCCTFEPPDKEEQEDTEMEMDNNINQQHSSLLLPEHLRSKSHDDNVKGCPQPLSKWYTGWSTTSAYPSASIHCKKGGPYGVTSTAVSSQVSSQGAQLLVNCTDSKLYLYNINSLSSTCGPVAEFSGHYCPPGNNSYYIKCGFSCDGNYVACGSADGDAHVWQVKQPDAAPLILRGSDGDVGAITWSNIEAAALCTAADDATVRLWQLHWERGGVDTSLEIDSDPVTDCDGHEVMAEDNLKPNIVDLSPRACHLVYAQTDLPHALCNAQTDHPHALCNAQTDHPHALGNAQTDHPHTLGHQNMTASLLAYTGKPFPLLEASIRTDNLFPSNIITHAPSPTLRPHSLTEGPSSVMSPMMSRLRGAPSVIGSRSRVAGINTSFLGSPSTSGKGRPVETAELDRHRLHKQESYHEGLGLHQNSHKENIGRSPVKMKRVQHTALVRMTGVGPSSPGQPPSADGASADGDEDKENVPPDWGLSGQRAPPAGVLRGSSIPDNGVVNRSQTTAELGHAGSHPIMRVAATTSRAHLVTDLMVPPHLMQRMAPQAASPGFEHIARSLATADGIVSRGQATLLGPGNVDPPGTYALHLSSRSRSAQLLEALTSGKLLSQINHMEADASPSLSPHLQPIALESMAAAVMEDPVMNTGNSLLGAFHTAATAEVLKDNEGTASQEEDVVCMSDALNHPLEVDAAETSAEELAPNAQGLKRHACAVDSEGLKRHACAVDSEGLKGHACAVDSEGLKGHACAVDSEGLKGHACAVDSEGLKGHACAVDSEGLKGHACAVDSEGWCGVYDDSLPASGCASSPLDMHPNLCFRVPIENLAASRPVFALSPLPPKGLGTSGAAVQSIGQGSMGQPLPMSRDKLDDKQSMMLSPLHDSAAEDICKAGSAPIQLSTSLDATSRCEWSTAPPVITQHVNSALMHKSKFNGAQETYPSKSKGPGVTYKHEGHDSREELSSWEKGRSDKGGELEVSEEELMPGVRVARRNEQQRKQRDASRSRAEDAEVRLRRRRPPPLSADNKMYVSQLRADATTMQHQRKEVDVVPAGRCSAGGGQAQELPVVAAATGHGPASERMHKRGTLLSDPPTSAHAPMPQHEKMPPEKTPPAQTQKHGKHGRQQTLLRYWIPQDVT
ncbi:hypothetical protein CEUSTIGMA_g11871.t1 [Chlamydomonas eustigma]|uniref:Anaphase-promoting complex subunit 4 WD40 domain-containing protein n=1 Tax=Chlamydomonas eustigma TaxID=1157962 RepID=A0A250XMZ0_9CHLO|nr:hypothetical protein CEUSTIGMA_g11871.t1 [Chlamydomonas eustigma]|eukprot:GAX84451.1 hypothetical protein CEUSTIGMA_g11871.t1 [Chlamydomonas eustigma]